jgi:carboxypeptidase family protein/TonB-dependent receptor-like protein
MRQHGSSVSSCIGKALCAILTLACLCDTGSALSLSTATLTGRVTDSNAAAIVGAKVDANNIDTNLTFSTVTNTEGLFVIPNLPPGRYRIFVQKDGFQTIVKPDVTLHVQDITSLSFSMQPGSLIQSVTIEGGAPLIQKESAAVGTLVDRQFVENLPLNGRSFQSLIALTPGVVLTKTNVEDQGQFSINGQRSNSNYFTIDGVSANIGASSGITPGQFNGGTLPGLSASGGTNNLVSVDALQEFKILTSTFAPEFGRTPGAQISIATRSGTNEFHGTVFDYFRNDALDANDWFANNRGLKKPALRQNDFGGVLGGPIIENRTFFFFSYEGLRLRLPQTGTTTVPSLSARQIASAGIRPFLDAFPQPNGSNLANNFAEFNATFSDPSSLDATSVRVDHVVSSKFTPFVRYNHAPSDTVQRGGSRSLNSLTTNSLNTQTITVGGALILTPAISNDLRVNYSRSSVATSVLLDTFGGATPLSDSLLFPSSFSSQDSLFNFVLTGGTNSILTQGKFSGNLQRQFNLVDTISVTLGAHQLKSGIDFRRLSPVFNALKYGRNDFFAGVDGALTGRANSVAISAFAGPLFPVFTNVSLFGQDTWKVTPRLTLTYGLRWELNPAPKEANGKAPLAVIGLDDPATLSLAPRGAPLYKTTYDNFAPRFGMGYQLSQSKGLEMILRGGIGVFYDLGSGPAGSAFGYGFPNTVEKFLSGALMPLDAASAAPPSFSLSPPYGNIRGAVAPDLKLPYSWQWNVAIEQSLGSHQTVSASYVGAVGRRLLRQEILRRPNPNFATVFATRNASSSDYHAMQLQYQRRLSRGLQALASYTWSHSIDDVSNDSSFGAPIGNIDLKQERGPSDFDVRHAFSAAVTYDIAVPPGKRFVNKILRNFSTDTIFTTRSAAPVNVLTGADGVGGFTGPNGISRPDLLIGVPLYINDPAAAGGRRINRAAFTLPVGRQGTLGRNALRGFPLWQMDFSLRRQFNITERVKFQLRAEFFNVFNHPNFGDPGAGANGTNIVTNPRFGQSINMLGRSLGSGGTSGGFNPLYQIGGPRSIQLALKLAF